MLGRIHMVVRTCVKDCTRGCVHVRCVVRSSYVTYGLQPVLLLAPSCILRQVRSQSQRLP